MPSSTLGILERVRQKTNRLLFPDFSRHRFLLRIKHIELGQKPAERPVFRKLHGVAHGWLERSRDIPDDLKVGVFGYERLAAWTRFSSDAAPTDPDLKTTIGIGIKVFCVPGIKALGDEGDTADFIMQNFPVFFVDDAQEMCEFTYAGIVAGNYPGYLDRHPEINKILNDMQKVEGSVLTSTYWAILPFLAGQNRYVKYRLDPERGPENVPNDAADYLAQDFAARLSKDEYRFRFMCNSAPTRRQCRSTKRPWSGRSRKVRSSMSPPWFFLGRTLGRPVRPNTASRSRSIFFASRRSRRRRLNPRLPTARKVVYAASADTRHNANGEPLRDSPEPRSDVATGSTPDSSVVKAVIYPPIGIARVGNSPNESFIGPETPDPPAAPLGFYRDNSGALKRQAARFRIYGVDARGQILRELSRATF